MILGSLLDVFLDVFCRRAAALFRFLRIGDRFRNQGSWRRVATISTASPSLPSHSSRKSSDPLARIRYRSPSIPTITLEVFLRVKIRIMVSAGSETSCKLY